MKRKFLTIITIGSIFCMILTGCGNKDSVTVSTDAIITNESENTIVNGNSLKNLNEKVIKIAEDMETQLEEYIEEEKIKEEASIVSSATLKELSQEEINEMVEEKLPEELVDAVTNEVIEEYNRRLKEKEEGIFYAPELIISEYTGLSDEEIISIINDRYFELHNELRKELGLPLFERDESLNKVADIRAEEISYFWSHNRPNGESVLGILSTLEMPSYGENIALHGYYEPSIKKLDLNEEGYKMLYEGVGEKGFEGLCNSPGHYANIIEKHYTKIGIDSYIKRYEDGVFVVYIAFEFGS